MKIRIKGNSIRMRLTKTDVDRFGAEGYIEERTDFGNNTFIYALRKNDGNALSASFVGVKITMLVPAHIITEWTTTNKVGYSNIIDLGNGKELSLLLEKDFQCIDAAVTEDQSDNYENPLQSCGPNEQSSATIEKHVDNAPAEEAHAHQDTEPISYDTESTEPIEEPAKDEDNDKVQAQWPI